MQLHFIKYQGAGNDFILLDGRTQDWPNLNVAALCNRYFGIGADGLMILKNHHEVDFEMVYYNNDGQLSSMCGNGGRCIAHFARSLGIGTNHLLQFMAVDGLHHAKVQQNTVSLGMMDVTEFQKISENALEIFTGSPHYIQICDTVMDDATFVEFGKSIRYSDKYKEKGINVNKVKLFGNLALEMRTYERGVEDETLSCGTGVTAAAMALAIQQQLPNGKYQILVNTRGGDLSVSFDLTENKFTNVILTGPATPVFKGEIEI